MNLVQILEKLEEYRKGSTNRGFGTLLFHYSNEFINLICVENSNKWETSYCLIKQWSIIIDIKKSFMHLVNFKKLEKVVSMKVTPVRRGKNKGHFGIRIYDMKAAPDEKIVNDVLDFIFHTGI